MNRSRGAADAVISGGVKGKDKKVSHSAKRSSRGGPVIRKEEKQGPAKETRKKIIACFRGGESGGNLSRTAGWRRRATLFHRKSERDRKRRIVKKCCQHRGHPPKEEEGPFLPSLRIQVSISRNAREKAFDRENAGPSLHGGALTGGGGRRYKKKTCANGKDQQLVMSGRRAISSEEKTVSVGGARARTAAHRKEKGRPLCGGERSRLRAVNQGRLGWNPLFIHVIGAVRKAV